MTASHGVADSGRASPRGLSGGEGRPGAPEEEPLPQRHGQGSGQALEGTQCHMGLTAEEGTVPSLSAARELQDKGREARTVGCT